MLKRGILIAAIFSLFSVLSVLVPQALGQTPVETQLRALLPPKALVPTLILSKEPVFYDKTTISIYLKEQVDTYLEYGFLGLISIGYYERGENLSVDICRMADPNGAYGIFTVSRVPKENDFKVGDGSVESKNSIVFWQNSFFVKITTLSSSENIRKSMEKIARVISQRIGVNSKLPDAVSYLPQKDLVPESVHYIMGPKGFSRYFKFYPESVFAAKENIYGGATATYRGDFDFFYMLLEYPNPYRATLTMDRILEELKSQNIPHYYLFNVLSYNMNNLYFKVDRIENFISIFQYKNKEFSYKWYLDRVKDKVYRK